MRKWPNSIPEDLRRRLTVTLSQRHAGPPEIWGDVVDWLRLHGAQPPDHPLPEYQPPARDGEG